MRTVLIGLFGLIGIIASGQHLQNTGWQLIKSERKDGSRILSRTVRDLEIKILKFRKDSVFYSLSPVLNSKKAYVATRTSLSIGGVFNYTIDFIDDTLLVITENPPEKLPDDKINRFYYINERFFYEYMAGEGQLMGDTDSAILGDRYCYPYLPNQDLVRILDSTFIDDNNLLQLYARIEIRPSDIILDFNLPQNLNLQSQDIENFKSGIQKTAGHWDFPAGYINPIRMYLIYMRIPLSDDQKKKIGATNNAAVTILLFGDKVILNEPLETKVNRSGFNLEQTYGKGIKLLRAKKFAEAIPFFDQCISNDSTNLDAHYNKAFALYQKGDTVAACEVWKLLETWGQKTAEAMVQEYCNK